MKAKDFKRWRLEIMRITQDEAAKALGISRSLVYLMESGQQPVELRTRLAMTALALGIRDYPYKLW